MGIGIGIGIGRVVVMPTTSFSTGLRLGLLSDLEGVLVTVSAVAVMTPATVRRRVVGGRERRRRRRHQKLASEGLLWIEPLTSFNFRC